MSDSNPVEQKLQSWVPRRPSPKIKTRLFAPKTEEPELDFPAFRRWLVPGTALFAALFTFNAHTTHEGFHLLNSSSTGLVAAVAMAEPRMASYASIDHSDHNVVQMTSAAFDWTNGSHSLTTAIPILEKNGLIQ